MAAAGDNDLPAPVPPSPSPLDPTQTAAPTTLAPAPVQSADAQDDPLVFGNPERYVILAEHGRGGLGRVSRAHDRGLGRDVAIKELLSRGLVSEVRFLREAMITARLEHPGIVPVHEAGRWADGTPFYAMKLVSGRPLRDLIAERATVDERIGLLHHVIAVADAIAYAHDRNIIHRDLKPANVIVGDFGETIVIDWGIAKDLTAPEDASAGGTSHGTPDDGLTAAGTVLGTPTYMAPEQERGEPVDQRADVFAIGAMLWELCSLEKAPPLDEHSRHRMLRRAGIDRDLAAIIDKALAPDPEHRYRHAGALAADLKAFKSGARITSRSYSLLAMLAHWTRRHRTLALSAMAFAVLLVASVVALAVLYRSSSRNAERASRNAEAARHNAETAQQRLIQAYVEQGRRLLLDGEYLRALPYLSEAYSQGNRSTAVRFLLAHAEGFVNTQLATHASSVRVRGAAFRPDGAHVLSVSDNAEAAVWDATTGKVVAVRPAQPGGPYPGSVSRDGAFAAIALPEGVTLWDGDHSRTMATGRVDRLAIDASGTRIAVAAGSDLSAWSVATGERLWTASAKVAMTQLVWAGDAVVAVGVDTIARLVDPTGEVLPPAGGPAGRAVGGPRFASLDGRRVVPLASRGPVYAAFTGAGRAIATVSENRVDLWDATGAPRGAITVGAAAVSAVVFSPDGSRIAVGGIDGIVRFYGPSGGAPLREVVGHRGNIRGMQFSDDGARLATTGADLSVRIWDVIGDRLIVSLLGARDPYSSTDPRFDAHGKRLVTTTQLGEARVFAVSDPDIVTSVNMGDNIVSAQLFDNGQRFATSSGNLLRIWSAATGIQAGQFDLPEKSKAAISPDGTTLAIIKMLQPDNSHASDIEIRDFASHQLVSRLHSSTQFAGVRFDHAGQRVVTVSVGRVVQLWNLRGEQLAIFQGHNRGISTSPFSATFSPDDRQIASPISGQVAQIWDIASGRELGRATLTAGLSNVEFDSTGTRFVTSSTDRIARVWDARSFALLHSFEHTGYLLFAAVSPDGTLVAGATSDGIVNISDMATSSLLAQFRHPGVTTVELSPTGDRVLSSGDDRAVIWRLELESRPPEVVAAFVRCHAPYRLVETRLEAETPECAGE